MWYRDEKWSPRLVAEQAVMRDRFSQMHLVQERDGTLRWVGILEPVSGAAFVVSVSYPARYPYAPPILRVERPALVAGAPHVYHDGSLCVHKAQPWDPLRGTAASMVPLIAAWLVAYSDWRRSGRTW